MVLLPYLITNPSNTLFIRLDDGKPVTCSKGNHQEWDRKKACNILSMLPKPLHKFNFRVCESFEKKGVSLEEKTIHRDYKTCEKVQEWIARLEGYESIASHAAARKEELILALSNTDKWINNWLHEIELSKPLNACDGYKSYRKLKQVLEQRRDIKDELYIISNALGLKISDFSEQRLHSMVKGLEKRKFTYRVTENMEDMQEE